MTERTGFSAEEVRQFFTSRVYGKVPAVASQADVTWQVLEEGTAATGGRRRQIRVDLTVPDGRQVRLTVLVRLPESASPQARVGAFCGMNFRGNHTCEADEAVLDVTEASAAGDRLHYAPERPVPVRGDQIARWSFDQVTERGWASITWCYLQLGMDKASHFEHGPHQLFSDHLVDERDPDEWGAISIWAWTMSRVLDAVVAGMIPEVDPQRVIAHGHSRLGKTAIWAGVNDPRFAAVISNNSGCLGATLTRERGETPTVLARAFPHWVTPNHAEVVEHWEDVFAGRAEPEVPDQPDLLALVAPRPLYVASASEDAWADPEGEYESWQQASAAWTGGPEATAGEFPEPGEVRAPTTAPLGYHLRDGAHAVEPFDWAAWLDFADRWVAQPD
ncbi:MAG TPA: acetylxylan esterase [Candidatus Avipropionibacterium avicola]|uniref:Acetylxylan esterase n=1 Tax=Candidatus Avipropionibacterium avicola TaxID=2840701 RepID=A0A9D1GVX6_9ACTN|nr:acetylxylan esterase [Candidatus Avipropionibacterium avicola]